MPRAPEAPAAPPAPRPEPQAEAEPETAGPEAPEQAVAALEPPAAEPERVVPRIITLEPPTAAVPPRARPVQRVEPNPTPPPPEPLRPAEEPVPELAPSPEAVVERPEETPAAPPEAAPETAAEAAPPATLALETAGRPLARRGNVAPRRSAQAEAVLAAVQQQRSPRQEATPATPPTEPTVTEPTEPTASSATSLPVGPPLTGSEKDGLRLAVQRCWNVPAGLRDAQELKVTLAAELAANGEVINASIRLIEPAQAPDGRFQQAYEAGRRALIRCSPYGDLPRDKYAQWRNIEVVFNPEGMVSW